MDDVPHLDALHFVEICKYLDANPVPSVQPVEISGRTPDLPPPADEARSVPELAGLLNSLCG